MSIKYLNSAFLARCPSRSSKAVLISLANHADDNGFTWIGTAQIAYEHQMSQRVIQTGRRELIKRGVINNAKLGNRQGTQIDYEKSLCMHEKTKIVRSEDECKNENSSPKDENNSLQGDTRNENNSPKDENSSFEGEVFAYKPSLTIKNHQKESTLTGSKESSKNPSVEKSKSESSKYRSPDLISKPKSKPNPQRGAHRIPEDWKLTPDLESYAIERGLNPSDTAEDFIEFFTNCTSSKALKKDWSLAFKRWCRNQVKFDAQRKAQQPKQKPDTIANRVSRWQDEYNQKRGKDEQDKRLENIFFPKENPLSIELSGGQNAIN